MGGKEPRDRPATAAAEKSLTEGRALSHPLGFQLTPQLHYYLPRKRDARTARKYVEKESLCVYVHRRQGRKRWILRKQEVFMPDTLTRAQNADTPPTADLFLVREPPFHSGQQCAWL